MSASKKHPVELIFEWIEEDKIQDLVEIKEWYLMLFERAVKNAYKAGCSDTYGIDEPSSDDPYDDEAAQNYFNIEFIKNK
jgi:hypothetical protein